jgi:predicted phosphoadenosine phosphosulfate sulfurtransferase
MLVEVSLSSGIDAGVILDMMMEKMQKKKTSLSKQNMSLNSIQSETQYIQLAEH